MHKLEKHKSCQTSLTFKGLETFKLLSHTWWLAQSSIWIPTLLNYKVSQITDKWQKRFYLHGNPLQNCQSSAGVHWQFPHAPVTVSLISVYQTLFMKTHVFKTTNHCDQQPWKDVMSVQTTTQMNLRVASTVLGNMSSHNTFANFLTCKQGWYTKGWISF